MAFTPRARRVGWQDSKADVGSAVTQLPAAYWLLAYGTGQQHALVKGDCGAIFVVPKPPDRLRWAS